MEPKYKHLLSPLQIRGHVLKNRVMAGNSLPYFLQGLEPYPADPVIAHYAGKAKGASIVTCMGYQQLFQRQATPHGYGRSSFSGF